ncbi:PIG-L family deacetylase [Streptomyces sp. NPDC052496]|uniref:PIG-L family deacetylase n=1 Tax=Streptomyces sp. NPDC052496 TaxID=3154951 RepID=UPI00343BD454
MPTHPTHPTPPAHPTPPSGPSRRRLLQVAGGGAAAVTAGAGVWAWCGPGAPLSQRTGTARGREAAASGAEQAFLHVIAHADDSLYFMNPALEQSLRSGARSVTVCLTGGESDGRNTAEHGRGARMPPRDRPAFARARTNGLRAAHAVMATGDPLSPWDVEAVSLLPGFQAEMQTLRAAPHHQLVFLELVEARTVSQPRARSLRGLWLGAVDTLPTLRPEDTPVQRTFQYTRQQLVDSLIALLERVRPTVVRTLDPNAVHAPHQPPPDGDPKVRGLLYYDHQDHIASAYFTQAALAGYWDREPGRPTVVEHYIGYEAGVLPNNVDLPTARRKAELLSVYGWADGRDCGDRAGCGDRKVGGTALDGWSRDWTRSTRLRAPGSNSWLRPLKDGRLAAFAVLDGTAVCWAETAPGNGTFSGPHRLGGGFLQGQIHAVSHPGGALQLFASRTVLPARNHAHRRELLTARQNGTARNGVPAFGPWESLGTPDAAPVASLETGFPAAAVGRDGTVHVFARDWNGGIAYRSGPQGGDWSLWRHLEAPAAPAGGRVPRLVDGLDACVDSEGLVHVVAPGDRAVHHWMSKEAGQIPEPTGDTGLPEPGGPLSLVPLGGGEVRLAYRQSRTAQVLLAVRRPRPGSWRTPARYEPVGGYGRVAAAAVGKPARTVVLAGRDDAGLLRYALSDSGEEAPGRWLTGEVPHSGAAAVGQDTDGRAVLAVLGNDGRLHVVRQRYAGADGAFQKWTAQPAPRGQTGPAKRTG